MNITDALKNVKEAALEGRKLEAWCEESCLALRYDGGDFELWEVYHRDGLLLKRRNKWEISVALGEVFATWHVRKVDE